MRRIPALLLTAALVLTAGCGGGGDDGDNNADDTRSAAPFAFPTVSENKPGVEPKVVSSTEPPDSTQVKVLHEGKGRAIGKDDLLVINLKGQVWDKDGIDLPSFVNSFRTGEVLIRPMGSVMPAWDKGLPGVKVGSRVLLLAPPADGFGPSYSGPGILPTDTLMFVIDIVDSVAPRTAADGKPVTVPLDPKLPTVGTGKDPKITVPTGVDPPKELVERLLQQGTGAAIKAGQTIISQYVGVIWRDGKVFDSSWGQGRHPFPARIAPEDPATGRDGVIKGWEKALVGEKVGSRVLLVIPPDLAYGKAGNAGAGIKATDTLVFVIDILGVYDKATSQ